jgi:hypothetical protein
MASLVLFHDVGWVRLIGPNPIQFKQIRFDFIKVFLFIPLRFVLCCFCVIFLTDDLCLSILCQFVPFHSILFHCISFC